MEIKILGINGSPRKGNSEFLLTEALSYTDNISNFKIKKKFYSFRGKEFKPCIACGYCGRNNGDCVHNDDFEDLKKLWMSSDIIIYSVPVYHMSMPGQVKCFLDRLGNSFFGTYKELFEEGHDTLPKLLKVIGSITQGAHIFSGQEHTLTDLINHALLMQSIPVVGDMWESYIGAAGWTNGRIERDSMKEEYNKGNFDTTIAVRASRKLVQRAVEMAVIVKSGLIDHKEYLSNDNHYKPVINRIMSETE